MTEMNLCVVCMQGGKESTHIIVSDASLFDVCVCVCVCICVCVGVGVCVVFVRMYATGVCTHVVCVCGCLVERWAVAHRTSSDIFESSFHSSKLKLLALFSLQLAQKICELHLPASSLSFGKGFPKCHSRPSLQVSSGDDYRCLRLCAEAPAGVKTLL